MAQTTVPIVRHQARRNRAPVLTHFDIAVSLQYSRAVLTDFISRHNPSLLRTQSLCIPANPAPLPAILEFPDTRPIFHLRQIGNGIPHSRSPSRDRIRKPKPPLCACPHEKRPSPTLRNAKIASIQDTRLHTVPCIPKLFNHVRQKKSRSQCRDTRNVLNHKPSRTNLR